MPLNDKENVLLTGYFIKSMKHVKQCVFKSTMRDLSVKGSTSIICDIETL